MSNSIYQIPQEIKRNLFTNCSMDEIRTRRIIGVSRFRLFFIIFGNARGERITEIHSAFERGFFYCISPLLFLFKLPINDFLAFRVRTHSHCIGNWCALRLFCPGFGNNPYLTTANAGSRLQQIPPSMVLIPVASISEISAALVPTPIRTVICSGHGFFYHQSPTFE